MKELARYGLRSLAALVGGGGVVQKCPCQSVKLHVFNDLYVSVGCRLAKTTFMLERRSLKIGGAGAKLCADDKISHRTAFFFPCTDAIVRSTVHCALCTVCCQALARLDRGKDGSGLALMNLAALRNSAPLILTLTNSTEFSTPTYNVS